MAAAQWVSPSSIRDWVSKLYTQSGIRVAIFTPAGDLTAPKSEFRRVEGHEESGGCCEDVKERVKVVQFSGCNNGDINRQDCFRWEGGGHWRTILNYPSRARASLLYRENRNNNRR